MTREGTIYAVPDAEIETHFDTSTPPRCEGFLGECPNQAVWSRRARHLDHTWCVTQLACDTCKNEDESTIYQIPACLVHWREIEDSVQWRRL